MKLIKVLSYILRHPLNRGNRLEALGRFVRWQLGSRILDGKAVLDWISGTRIVVGAAEAGLTGNIYCGLHEFEDMSFVLHVLISGDLFVDVGANAGSYTVLACGAAGASGIAVEPVPSTFSRLLDNIRVNGLADRVEALNIGLGQDRGFLMFSQNKDTCNHVVSESEDGEDAIEVPVRTLDDVLGGRHPTLIKIDVEGYEAFVLRGSSQTLLDESLLAVILEVNGSDDRYGFADSQAHEMMKRQGFTPCSYDPFSRLLVFNDHPQKHTAMNCIYVRNVDVLRDRIRAARRHVVHGHAL